MVPQEEPETVTLAGLSRIFILRGTKGETGGGCSRFVLALECQTIVSFADATIVRKTCYWMIADVGCG
jgi:hypothetical protein